MSSEEGLRAARPKPSFRLTRKNILVLSISIAGALTLLSSVINVVIRGLPPSAPFDSNIPAAEQILWGLALAALGVAFVSLTVFKVDFLAGFRSLLGKILGDIRPGITEMIVVSLAAGFSEELFFRGTLQPLIGLWLTSLVFAVAHVGIPTNKGRLAFVGFVFAMGLIWGVTYQQLGLGSAMVAHAAYDLGFLLVCKKAFAWKAV